MLTTFFILSEEMHGLDTLLDLVDDWNLDQDLPLEDDDKDSWSQSSSSLFEDDILDDSLLL